MSNERYFSISSAVDEIKNSSGAQETAISSAKLLGKGVFNVAKFAVVEVLPAFIDNSLKTNIRHSNELLKRDDLSDEQRRTLESGRDSSQEALSRMQRK